MAEGLAVGKNPRPSRVVPDVTVTKLSMIYDADSGISGELRYVLGTIRGNHCALCDISHGKLRKKSEFEELTCSLEIPVDVLHRNEQSPELAAFTAGLEPLVVAHRQEDLEVLLSAADLDQVDGDVDAFAQLLKSALAETEQV